MTEQRDEHQPTTREKLKPAELIGFSVVMAVFAAVVVGIATRDYEMLVPVAAISVFIVTLMVLALLGLSMKPNPEDVVMRNSAAEIAAAADAQHTAVGEQSTATSAQGAKGADAPSAEHTDTKAADSAAATDEPEVDPEQ